MAEHEKPDYEWWSDQVIEEADKPDGDLQFLLISFLAELSRYESDARDHTKEVEIIARIAGEATEYSQIHNDLYVEKLKERNKGRNSGILGLLRRREIQDLGYMREKDKAERFQSLAQTATLILASWVK